MAETVAGRLQIRSAAVRISHVIRAILATPSLSFNLSLLLKSFDMSSSFRAPALGKGLSANVQISAIALTEYLFYAGGQLFAKHSYPETSAEQRPWAILPVNPADMISRKQSCRRVRMATKMQHRWQI